MADDTVDVHDPAILGLIDRRAPVEQLCTGFRFTEGPIWNQREQRLYFSDMPGDVRRYWSDADGVVEVRNRRVNDQDTLSGADRSALAWVPAFQCFGVPIDFAGAQVRTAQCVGCLL